MSFRQISTRLAVFVLVLCAAFISTSSLAQTGGQGAITGTVTDSTGALVPKATVTALNVATGVQTIRITTSDGLYNISPAHPRYLHHHGVQPRDLRHSGRKTSPSTP